MTYLNLDDIEEREIVPGFFGRFVHTDDTTVAHWRVVKDAAIPMHSHVSEQIANLIEGRFEFNVDGDKKSIIPGEVVVIPSNVKHGGRALTDCRIIEVFNPARDDYR